MDSLSTSEDIAAAVERLKSGGVIALPTETVYGLAADACNARAVAGVFALKQRPSFNPLIVHVADIEMARRYVIWNALAHDLAEQHWPGPLTLVLSKKDDSPIADLVSAGGDTLAIRVPAHPVALAVIRKLDGGIAAPSANRSGRISPTKPEHVKEEFPDMNLMILDGGPTQVGIESTVVDCTGPLPTLLRPGIVQVDAQSASDAGSVRSPGQLASHYAPSIPVRLDAWEVAKSEALLAYGPAPLKGAGKILNLSEHGNLHEAAANLFAMMRELDNKKYKAIAVMPIPRVGIGIAINDRLQRAAAERS